MVKVLRRAGFVLVGQADSHQKWRHADGRQVIVAMHGGKPIPIGTLKSIIQGSGLDTNDFRWDLHDEQDFLASQPAITKR